MHEFIVDLVELLLVRLKAETDRIRCRLSDGGIGVFQLPAEHGERDLLPLPVEEHPRHELGIFRGQGVLLLLVLDDGFRVRFDRTLKSCKQDAAERFLQLFSEGAFQHHAEVLCKFVVDERIYFIVIVHLPFVEGIGGVLREADVGKAVCRVEFFVADDQLLARREHIIRALCLFGCCEKSLKGRLRLFERHAAVRKVVYFCHTVLHRFIPIYFTPLFAFCQSPIFAEDQPRRKADHHPIQIEKEHDEKRQRPVQLLLVPEAGIDEEDGARPEPQNGDKQAFFPSLFRCFLGRRVEVQEHGGKKAPAKQKEYLQYTVEWLRQRTDEVPQEHKHPDDAAEEHDDRKGEQESKEARS